MTGYNFIITAIYNDPKNSCMAKSETIEKSNKSEVLEVINQNLSNGNWDILVITKPKEKTN